MEVNMKMYGGRELEELMLKHLPVKVARRSMLTGFRKAAQPTMNIAKAKVAVRSGALQKSIGLVTLPQRRTAKMVGMESSFAAMRLGPLTGQGRIPLHAWSVYQSYYRGGKVQKNRLKFTAKKGAPIGQIRHGHLVEWGFKMRDGRKYPGRPFMTPAAQLGGPIFVNTVVSYTRTAVDAAIRRHNAKSSARRRRRRR